MSLNFEPTTANPKRLVTLVTATAFCEGPVLNANVLKISLDQCDPQWAEYPETPTTTLVVCVAEADDPAAKYPFRHPVTGETQWAAYKVLVSIQSSPYTPSPNYGNANVAAYDGGDNAKPEFKSLTNNEVNEIFDHNSVNIVFDWTSTIACR